MSVCYETQSAGFFFPFHLCPNPCLLPGFLHPVALRRHLVEARLPSRRQHSSHHASSCLVAHCGLLLHNRWKWKSASFFAKILGHPCSSQLLLPIWFQVSTDVMFSLLLERTPL